MEKRNTKEIVKLAKEKSDKTKTKVEKTISEMAIKSETINFNSVSIRANVSKSWLYKNKDIRDRIETLRNQQVRKVMSLKNKKNSRSESILIKSLKERIKTLEAENRDLKHEVEKLYGKYF
ncbi:transposase [Bacillus sp. EB93]|uniref:DUF6262 family protein n=1 Tax=Peribacillus TaxID=2675229 RepID=UPI001379D1BF|nr:DUF6262 family protein [Peribacillus frigoritolerans]NCT37278.1 transposase [Peribacillus frigoritolerans]USK63572.1 DUF6262 family protein [Peribacillus frigoritolerans]USK68235.1 DUF6262 family protein [Peribacillus frigoritolerans]